MNLFVAIYALHCNVTVMMQENYFVFQTLDFLMIIHDAPVVADNISVKSCIKRKCELQLFHVFFWVLQIARVACIREGSR
jgi:hypothetical protein